MKTFLQIFTLIAVFALVAPAAKAQHAIDTATVGGISLNGGTNGLAGLTTNTTDSIVVTRGQNAAVAVSFAAPSGSTSNLIVRIDASVDNDPTHWFPNAWTFVTAATSTTTNTYSTNITVGAYGYLRVNLCNTNAADNGARMTNFFVKIGTKPGI